MNATTISTSGLVKTFGPTRALDGLDLSVRTGEVHGFLGPNGAGKTTTIRILLGLLRADAGRTELLGGDPWRDAVALHRRLAYVPGDVTLWPNLSGGEVIDLLGRLRGGLDPKRRAELLERFDLDPRKKARTYSKGNRLQGQPPEGRPHRRARLRRGAAAAAGRAHRRPGPADGGHLPPGDHREHHDGRTVLLSSHILAEVEALADRVSIIRAGRVVESGTLAELRHLTRTSVTAELAAPPDGLRGLPGVHNLEVDGTRVHLQVDTASLDGVLRQLSAVGVRSLVSQPPTLEELFLRHYGDTEPSIAKEPA
jgi:ABC-2 type transport system ATP-binding protein